MVAVPSTGRADQAHRVAAPEADATRALYERYANQIFGYCLHQLGSREEAEDAVQSTFLNAFRGLRRGVVPELEAAWLFKIAHNVCLSRRRSSWRRGRIESPADFELVEELAPAPARRADELIGLQEVLETMPENQRRAILLREWQGLSYHEIAEELELSQAAVETLIFRARRSLAQGLEEPPESVRRRARHAGDLGNLIAAVKSMLFGSAAAVKVAATVAVVSATTVVAAAPVEQHRRHPPTPAVPAPSHAAHPAGIAAPATAGPPPAPAPKQTGAPARRGDHRSGSVPASGGAPLGPTATLDRGTIAADPQAQAPAPAPADAEPAPQPEATAPAPAPASPAPAPAASSRQDRGATHTAVKAPLSQTATPGLTQTNGSPPRADQTFAGSLTDQQSSAARSGRRIHVTVPPGPVSGDGSSDSTARPTPLPPLGRPSGPPATTTSGAGDGGSATTGSTGGEPGSSMSVSPITSPVTTTSGTSGATPTLAGGGAPNADS